MELTNKNFKIHKTKNFIKKRKLFFFFNGVNQNSQDWLRAEQNLQTLDLSYYKIFNKITIKLFQESVYNNIKPTIRGITVFISFNKNYKKILTKNETNKIDSLFFTFIAIKFNNKIYSGTSYKTIYSKEYVENKLIFYKFINTHLKLMV